MKILSAFFVVAMCTISTASFGQTLRVINDTDHAIMASVVSGTTIANQSMPAFTWFDFQLKNDTSDRILILRTTDDEDAQERGPEKVIATQTINASRSPSKLIVSLLRGGTEHDLEMFCIGRGNLLPTAERPISEDRLRVLSNELHSAAKRVTKIDREVRL